jgi:succinate-acetate transporter protein
MAQATETKTAVAVANPAPLGLIAFATTTLVLSAANANFTGVNAGGAVTLAFAFGGLAQLLAGMWEFKNGNTFGGVAFSSYGAFWISYWAYFTFSGDGALLSAKGAENDLGWYLIGWAVVTGVYLICTFRLNYGLVVVFALLFITYILLAIGAFNPPAAGSQPSPIAGYVGIATAVAAYYVGLADLLKAVSKGSINLPVGPIK